MKLPNISARSEGFTLIEITLVIALFVGLLAMGIITGTDSYQRHIFRAELEKTAALLQKARSSAMANVGETSHGIYFGDASDILLFRGMTYDPLSPYNLKIERSKAVSISGPATIIFTPLSGTSTAGTLTLNDGVRNAIITINNEGEINW